LLAARLAIVKAEDLMGDAAFWGETIIMYEQSVSESDEINKECSEVECCC